MAKTTPTTPYTIAQGEKYWEVFENGNIRASFDALEQAEYWCTINNLEYTVI